MLRTSAGLVIAIAMFCLGCRSGDSSTRGVVLLRYNPGSESTEQREKGFLDTLAKEYPGVKVIKIGLDYRTWVPRKSLDYVASDEIFRYYRVSYNSYKRGTVLLQIPGRPFCQMQDFVVGLNGGRVVPAGVGGSGTFMRCD